MATGSGNTTVYDCQKVACRKFFVELLPDSSELSIPIPEDEVPANMKRFKGPIYDITGFDAHQVIAVLVSIVNNENQFKRGKNFYLLLRNHHENEPDDEIEELFRLGANPTPDQPGNGVVFLRPRKRKTFKRSCKTYTELNGALEAIYEKQEKQIDTASFARDIKILLHNNAEIKSDFPQPTIEVYLLWLFEIARRLVIVQDPTKKKQEFDVLPIGSAIARILELLNCGRPEICTFEDVLLPQKKYAVFVGTKNAREEAIEKINKTSSDILKRKSTVISAHLQELEETFCSKERQEITLGKQFQDVMKKTEEYSSMKSSFNAESSSAEDHFLEDSQE